MRDTCSCSCLLNVRLHGDAGVRGVLTLSRKAADRGFYCVLDRAFGGQFDMDGDWHSSVGVKLMKVEGLNDRYSNFRARVVK